MFLTIFCIKDPSPLNSKGNIFLINWNQSMSVYIVNTEGEPRLEMDARLNLEEGQSSIMKH